MHSRSLQNIQAKCLDENEIFIIKDGNVYLLQNHWIGKLDLIPQIIVEKQALQKNLQYVRNQPKIGKAIEIKPGNNANPSLFCILYEQS